MGDWNKWKHWLTFAVSIWTLLAFVFTVQRYGGTLFSPETAVQLWNKAGDFILLRWLNSTIITGLFAIIAALIGAYALHSGACAQTKLNKLSAINVCRANASIMRDHFDSKQLRLPTAESARQFQLAAEGLALIDPQLTWLSISTAMLPLRIANNRKIMPGENHHAYIQCAILVDILGSIYDQINSDTFCLITPTSSIIIDSVKRAYNKGYSPKELGPFATFIGSTLLDAAAEPHSKS